MPDDEFSDGLREGAALAVEQATGEKLPMLHAPWTDVEVAALNRWQGYGFVHEFSCPNDSSVLVAHNDGWHCPKCAYTQDWAHAFMLQPQRNPLEADET